MSVAAIQGPILSKNAQKRGNLKSHSTAKTVVEP